MQGFIFSKSPEFLAYYSEMLGGGMLKCGPDGYPGNPVADIIRHAQALGASEYNEPLFLIDRALFSFAGTDFAGLDNIRRAFAKADPVIVLVTMYPSDKNAALATADAVLYAGCRKADVAAAYDAECAKRKRVQNKIESAATEHERKTRRRELEQEKKTRHRELEQERETRRRELEQERKTRKWQVISALLAAIFASCGLYVNNRLREGRTAAHDVSWYAELGHGERSAGGINSLLYIWPGRAADLFKVTYLPDTDLVKVNGLSMGEELLLSKGKSFERRLTFVVEASPEKLRANQHKLHIELSSAAETSASDPVVVLLPRKVLIQEAKRLELARPRPANQEVQSTKDPPHPG